MKKLADAAEELARQYEFVSADRLPRILGASTGFLLAMGFVPARAVALALAIYLLSEALQPVLMRRLEAKLEHGRYALVLANSTLGSCAFSFPALMLLLEGSKSLHIAAAMYLTGALLNAAMVRATHLPQGISVAIPPALVLLYGTLPTSLKAGQEELFTFATVIVLLGYFAAALVVNHRMQADLAAARNAAEQASNAKSRFLSAISHDMRTPLNAIQGMGQLLAVPDAAVDVRAGAETIEAAALMLRTIVDDVLDFTASRNEALSIKPVIAPLAPELDAVIAQHQPQTEAAGQALVCELTDLPALVRVDTVRLRQCLRGMLVAANGAFAPGMLHLQASQHPLSDDRIAVQFDMTGAVMPGRYADPTDPLIELATTLARAMDGSLHLRSRMNPSVTLRLTLGRVETESRPALSTIKGCRVLVVDDISTNRLVVMHMLKHLGYDCEEVSGGNAALLALEKYRYDVVLLDLNMPVMDGMETLRAIRMAGTNWAGIPVIGLTADSEALHQCETLLEAGMTSLVIKPVTGEILHTEIARAVQNQDARQI